MQTATHAQNAAKPQIRTAGAQSVAAHDREGFEALARLGTRQLVRRGTEVFAQGEEASYCYKVLSGHAMAAKLTPDGRRNVCEFLLPGDFFGLDCEEEHYFTVSAITDLVVLKYPRRAIERALVENPTIARAVQKATAAELHSAYQRMMLLTHKSAEERVAWFLLELADRMENTGKAKSTEVHLPMTRSDIADYLGMVIETVSRALSHLKRVGAISMQGASEIRLVNRGQLEAVCGDL